MPRECARRTCPRKDAAARQRPQPSRADPKGEPVTAEDVKARYKKLVKLHHPDANGGDKAAEERFKQINLAYHTIMQSLSP
ncbi:DnaJ domain-containing protein [bacterium]|nr:DnaJ domain-containing protein [bacterium]